MKIIIQTMPKLNNNTKNNYNYNKMRHMQNKDDISLPVPLI